MPPMGNSSQNTLLNNFAPLQLILTCNTPMNSAQLAESEDHQKFSKLQFRGKIGEFPKNTPLNNFWTVRPIFTNNILVDSSQQGAQNEIIKISFHEGKRGIFVKKPLNNLSTFRPISTINIRSSESVGHNEFRKEAEAFNRLDDGKRCSKLSHNDCRYWPLRASKF
jgi:hypothetical protein